MTKNKSNKNKKEDKWIPLAYHRIQKIHLGEDGKGYTSLKDFFNAMVTKYKFRIESGILQSDHTLVTYDDKNKLLAEINLKPTIEQRNSAGLAEMVDKFVLSWCKSHPAKYLFRLHLGYLMADDNKEITFNFMAEDLIEAYSKQFRIITKENVANTLELV